MFMIILRYAQVTTEYMMQNNTSLKQKNGK